MGFTNFLDYLEEFNTASIILRLVLSTLFGGIIGIERESKGRSAGFRTFTLVCLASALGTIVNLHLFNLTGAADVGRIPAALVSGIGFLGVGTIIITKRNHVKGLTTAAGLWVTATLGISLGAGMIWESLVAFVLVLITVSVLQNMSHYISNHNRVINIYIEMAKESDAGKIINYARSNDFSILSMEKKREKITKDCDMVVNLSLNLKKSKSHEEIINDIGKIEGVLYIEEVYN
ncbi:MAG: MgtC/SapB family protein [Acetatifactor sp.]|nr:MgtC/SapB family protein [Acetatifactor sp.]